MKEYGDKVFDTRDEAGNVKVGKKNFSTNPMKKGYGASTTGHLFGEYPYQGNPYDLPRELETVRIKFNHRNKELSTKRTSQSHLSELPTLIKFSLRITPFT